MIHNCRECDVPLVVDENITQYRIDHRQYICRSCRREYDQEYRQKHREHNRNRLREYTHRMGIRHPMSENRACSSFLGVYVAEQVLSHVFKNVERMPYINSGFDFICGQGYKIDVKSSCSRKNGGWAFHIKRNTIADYFLCLAFDNRQDLNPLYIWLIPGDNLNHLTGASIQPSTIHKWDEYRLDISKVITCCNVMKEKSEDE